MTTGVKAPTPLALLIIGALSLTTEIFSLSLTTSRLVSFETDLAGEDSATWSDLLTSALTFYMVGAD